MVKKKRLIHRYTSATEKMKACSHVIFCNGFGEYKCNICFHTIQNAELECIGCKYHTCRPTNETMKMCHCEVCMKKNAE